MSKHELLGLKPVLSLEETIDKQSAGEDWRDTKLYDVLKNIEQAHKCLGKVYLRKYIMAYRTGDKIHNYEMVSRDCDITFLEEIGRKTNAVSIVPKLKGTDLYVVCREFRYAVNDYCWEFPAGLIDEGETVEQAAIRELKEETGYDVVDVTLVLPGGFSSAGMTDEKVSLAFVEVDGTADKSLLGENEDIEVHLLTKEKLIELIKKEDVKCCSRLQCVVAGMALN